MTFEELQTELINRARTKLLCTYDPYQALLLATDNNSLIAAAAGYFEYIYNAGIFDDTLSTEFTDEELNAHGIYKNNVTLENPDHDVYFIGETVSSITISDGNKCNIYLMNAANITITGSGNALLNIKCCDNTIATISLNNNACSMFESIGNANVNITANDNSVIQIKASNEAITYYEGRNKAYSIISTFTHSTLTYRLINETSLVDTKASNSSTITLLPNDL